MGYPGERASKINHREIVESEEVRAYLDRCEKVPPQIDILNFQDSCIELSQISDQLDSHIERIVVVDGSCAEVPINQEFPSYKLCYYIIGICTFPLKNLETLENKQTIDHLDIKELENYERFTFVMPMQNIRLEEKDFTTTFRETLYEIFKENGLNEGEYSLLDTLKWLVFQEYSSKKDLSRFLVGIVNISIILASK
ncbi:hypothetical protein [Helicobacter suis]|uniref:hypothetical protein n=1 Tax=Helicobacter suis TaxID=104628 RepID=UPI001F081D9D|nr:hypothetical protein [Helicobacter suis]